MLGTPGYMSPEQCKGADVDHRADIYAFGVLAFRMLTGQLPFRGANEFVVMEAHVHQTPPDPRSIEPSIPAPVARVVEWLLAKQPEDRPENLGVAIDALERAAKGERVRRPKRARLMLLAAAALFGLAIFLGTTSQSAPTPPAAAPVAEPPAVRIELRGLPEATRVASNDEPLEVRAGALQLPRSGEARTLEFAAPGFEPTSAKVTPDKDQVLSVQMDAVRREPEPSEPPKKIQRTVLPVRKAKAKPKAMPSAKPSAEPDAHDLEPWD